MRIEIPEMALVLLIGTSGSGKSTFGARHFLPTEIVSSDHMRGLVSDDESDQSATQEAFEALHFLVDLRLRRGKLTVVDATNVLPASRRELIAIAKKNYVLSVAIVFGIDERLCLERNRSRPDRDFGPHVIRRQADALRRGRSMLRKEGFLKVYNFETPEQVDSATIERTKLFNDLRERTGPFDIIGDVHGCRAELESLLLKLGYQANEEQGFTPPEGRTAIFLGDLVDRGPDSVGVLRLVMKMVRSGAALCVPGNHDDKLLRALLGRQVSPTHGLAETLQQLKSEPAEFIEEVKTFLDGLISHYVLDGGKLVVAHAGIKELMIGRGSARIREFALYGETTGETDKDGLPVRIDWAADYRGEAMVVYGHTPVAKPEWLNRTICIDGGVPFGGELYALRYPELELESVPALVQYGEPARPFKGLQVSSAQHRADWIDYHEVTGRRFIDTGLRRRILIEEERAIAAVELMSRFGANPKWLAYLPPTMSPCETSAIEGYLERPEEAFAYFRTNGVAKVVCEEKHMGSRAVVVLCRNPEIARSRFGLSQAAWGTVVTRTGRPFFNDSALESALLQRIAAAAETSGLWEELGTEWMILDAELMPWSAKAIGLLRSQYAAVGTAATHALAFASAAAKQAQDNGVELEGLPEVVSQKVGRAAAYVEAYRRYCWTTANLDDYRLAPFHLLATEGHVYSDQNHEWHMTTLARLAEPEPILLATPFHVVDLADESQVAAATRWWEEMTDQGKEGMVVKPYDFIVHNDKSELVQPALKECGREYLRIIYGPDYDLPENVARLRKRGTGRKRNLASREFALGLHALDLFVASAPLRDIHNCVLGVLALETEPVDARL